MPLELTRQRRLNIYHATRQTFLGLLGFDLSVSHFDSVARRKREFLGGDIKAEGIPPIN